MLTSREHSGPSSRLWQFGIPGAYHRALITYCRKRPRSKQNLHRRYGSLGEHGAGSVALLESMLRFAPGERVTIKEALASDFFTQPLLSAAPPSPAVAAERIGQLDSVGTRVQSWSAAVKGGATSPNEAARVEAADARAVAFDFEDAAYPEGKLWTNEQLQPFLEREVSGVNVPGDRAVRGDSSRSPPAKRPRE